MALCYIPSGTIDIIVWGYLPLIILGGTDIQRYDGNQTLSILPFVEHMSVYNRCLRATYDVLSDSPLSIALLVKHDDKTRAIRSRKRRLVMLDLFLLNVT